MRMYVNLSHPRFSFRGLESETITYVSAVESADNQSLEKTVINAINDFVRGCKNDDIWDAIKASCILAGARTLAGALVPLKGPSPTNVSNLFVSGDYNRASGLKGNGSTKYLNSNRNNNADPQNNQHISIYLSETDTTTSGILGLIGVGGTNEGESHIGYNKNSSEYFLRNRSSSFAVSSSISQAIGIHAMSRTNSSTVDTIIPGFASSISLSSISPRNSTIKVFARDQTPYFGGRLSFYSIGEALDIAKLNSRVSALISEFSKL